MNRASDDRLGGALPPELERALEAAPRVPRAAFTDRVMARVAAERRELVVEAARWESAPALEWWVRAAADPAVALALVLGALLLWRAEAVLAAIQAAFALLPALHAPPALTPPLAVLGRGETALALSLALLPAVVWGSWGLCLWAERRTQSASHAPRLR